MKPTTSIPLLVATVLGACGAPSVVHNRPVDPARNRAVTALWARDIARVARDGDWILSRSYSAIGDMIVLGTGGPSLSHASIYDAERNMAIEAVSSGVHAVPLEQLLDRNRVVIVVRPHGLDDRGRRESVLRARAAVGRDFDTAGMFGFDSPESFYCSELVVWASGIVLDSRVITPSELVEHGEVIYLSGNRDSAELQEAAIAQKARGVRQDFAGRGRASRPPAKSGNNDTRVASRSRSDR